jgi:hypothetical protein
MRARHILSETTLALAGLSFLWACYLLLFGGFDLRLFGISFTSNEPLRPLLFAVVASVIFLWSAPPERRQRVLAALAGYIRPAVFVPALSAGVALAGWLYATTAPGGADSYGYASQADLWLGGDLKTAQPWVERLPWPSREWTAAPLGYRPAPGDSSGTLVPIYSPGFPLLLAGAKLAGAHCAMFLVVPLCGALMVASTYGIGRRLQTPATGLLAAALVATSPIFLFFLMVPMSDVPVSAFWALAFYCMLGTSTRSAFAAGLSSSVAVLIRPNLFFLAGLIGLRYVLVRLDARDGGQNWPARVRLALAFCLGAAPGFVAIALIYNSLYGSPFTSGYGRFEDQFALSNVWANAPRYFSWLAESQTPLALAGAVALLLPVRQLWPQVPDRRVVVLLGFSALAVWILYFTYSVFDHWLFLRFLLPSWPLLMVGLASFIALLFRLPVPRLAELGVLVAIVLCAHGLQSARTRRVFDTWYRDREYVAVARTVGTDSPQQSVFLTMQHSGSLRYYAGRLTIRYDEIAPDWLDRAIDWFTAQGVPLYALLDEWEVPEFRKRFAGQSSLARLEVPRWAFRGDRTVYVYDLSTKPGEPIVTADRTSVLRNVGRCEPPVELTVPVFRVP